MARSKFFTALLVSTLLATTTATVANASPISGSNTAPSIVTHTAEEHMPLYHDDSADGFCERDRIASNFQNCAIYSPANKTLMRIHFKPATHHSTKVVMLLDGASAVDTHNRWVNLGGAARTFAGKNINVILPIGGGASYYADFQYPYRGCSLVHPTLNMQQWETFLTKDVVRWAQQQKLSTRRWRIGGFSMGGGSALALAERHPSIFAKAFSFSGLNTIALPGVQEMLTTTSDITACMWAPFGTPVNPSRYEFDPYLNMEKLTSLDFVYLSAASGFTPSDYHVGDASSAFWEWGVLASTVAFSEKAAVMGLSNVCTEIFPEGSHTYRTAYYALNKALPYILAG